MPDPMLSILASLLRPVTKSVQQLAKRMHGERKAGQQPTKSSLMDIPLNETMGRLQGGSINEAWWRNILLRIGLVYIAPDFLRQPALREWLAGEQVADDLKSLAKEMILMGETIRNPEFHGRLAESYSNQTGESSDLADDPIDVVVAILVAGFIASVTSDLRPVAGMLQESHVQLNARIDQLEDNLLTAVSAPITQHHQLHTNLAKQELSNILSLRVYDASGSRRKIRDLLGRVSDGDLTGASNPTKTNILHWTAKLCATENETLALAKQLRDEIEQTDPDIDLSVVDALIAEMDGDTDLALRLLRDPDDQDTRSAWFRLLSRLKGKDTALKWFDQQDDRDNRHFFTPFGWAQWAMYACENKKWEEALTYLVDLGDCWDEMPMLADMEGRINAAMLLPSDFRKMVLEDIPLYQGVAPNQGKTAEKHHARATACMNYVGKRLQRLTNDQNLAKEFANWSLWLKLMNPRYDSAKIAHEEISLSMNQGGQAVDAMPFAFTFEIPFNTDPLKNYLNQRKSLGGLDDRELTAEYLLSIKSLIPNDLMTYLDVNKTRLTKVIPPQFLKSVYDAALEEDNQKPGESREVVDEDGTIDKDQPDRLITLKRSSAGHELVQKFMELYRQSKGYVDLQNLINQLKIVGDRAALLPLVRERFDRAPTIVNALDVVGCLGDPSSYDHQSIIEFLEENSDILEQSNDLKAVKATALFHAGQFEDSRKINKYLLRQRINVDYLLLDLRIAIASGDWERIGAILNNAWNQRDSYNPDTLIAFAQLAGQQGQMHTRALQLAKLAVKKAPDDPRILMAAYWQHYKLGREDEADPAWFERAVTLSSESEGPVWSVDLPDLTNNWIPKRRDHLREVERKWLNGEIPMSLAAGVFNVSLARIFLHIPDQNANESDGRCKVILPISAGTRNPIELQKTWTVGLDVTSIMVLSYLDLLEKTIDSFCHVKLAPEIMEHLFQEQDEVRFHQPSRIDAAKQVIQLLGQGKLKVADKPVMPPKGIIDEVGRNLATLLQMAREDKGKLVCAFPVHKAGSLMEQQADTSTFDDLIISSMDFCKLLHDSGRIGATDYQHARSFLLSQGQTERSCLPSSILDGPIYMEGLAFRYMLDAKVLHKVAASSMSGLIIRVHPDILQEMRELTEEGDTGQGLIDKIERIRHILRTTVDNKKASFLPRSADLNGQIQNSEIRFEATSSLLAGGSACDALCIDDRYINRNPALTVPKGQTIPIVCVLDVLRHLVAQDCINAPEYCAARHKLRHGSFAFIPLETQELVHWLKNANFNNGVLTESLELRILRQTTAYVNSLGLSNLNEAFTMSANCREVCNQVILDLWENGDKTPEEASWLSDWVWRNLMVAAIPGRGNLTHDAYTNLVQELVSLRLGILLLPRTTRTEERHIQYADWLERYILQLMRPANKDRIERALELVRDVISDIDISQAAYGNLFLRRLPESARKMIIKGDAEFAKQCGFQAEPIFTIGPKIKFECNDLFTAADEVLASKREKSIEDITGNKVVIGIEKENQNILVKWSDAKNAPQKTLIPSLTLLSPSSETRQSVLNNIIREFGPSATEFRNLLEDIRSRKPSYQELFMLLDEATNGVMAFQAKMIHKIQHRMQLSVTDIIPQSTSYFEYFAGPNPGSQEPEMYLQETLTSYRRDILSQNLGVGLDICCLGALRDDLSPGQWVVDIDDDTIWDALPSCHAKSNPFSLLGVLDIALYRQNDKRFRDFAAEAVIQLSDENFGQKDDSAIYRLLQVFAGFVRNRISLLENGVHYPGYWKRMSAWMQAGLIVRPMVEPTFLDDVNNLVESLQKWTQGNMVVTGIFAELIDARKEPMLFADRLTSKNLQVEILKRLHILKLRHESEGRHVPGSENIDLALNRTMDRGTMVLLRLPGPLEGHIRPTETMQQETKQSPEDVLAENSDPIESFALASHFFALGLPELDRARSAVKTILENNKEDSDLHTILKKMELASIVAVANRDTKLADGIANVVIGISPRASEEDVQIILLVILQAAAANETLDAWLEWLDEKFSGIATHLPAPPNKSLGIFLDYLCEIDIVLPANSWFHIRAKSIATAGAI